LVTDLLRKKSSLRLSKNKNLRILPKNWAHD
jgi:hypothetical protein